MVYAIIPARAGSKGVPGKNTKLLNGYPLIAYSIALAKMVKAISRVVVSTDSKEIAVIAQRYGAETPFLRPAEFAQDKSADIDFVLHALNWFKENENKIPDYLVHLRPTTPLRDPEIASKAINEIINCPQATSLRSAHQAAESPFKWFLRDEQGFFRGLQDNCSNDYINLPRQQFPIVYIPDGYVDVLKTSYILSSGSLLGDKMLGFISPFCTEVDCPQDFEFLEYELKKRTQPVFEYLKKNFSKEG